MKTEAKETDPVDDGSGYGDVSNLSLSLSPKSRGLASPWAVGFRVLVTGQPDSPRPAVRPAPREEWKKAAMEGSQTNLAINDSNDGSGHKSERAPAPKRERSHYGNYGRLRQQRTKFRKLYKGRGTVELTRHCQTERTMSSPIFQAIAQACQLSYLFISALAPSDSQELLTSLSTGQA